MDLEVVFRVVLYFALLLMSGFFSGSETAMFSISEVQLMRLAEEGHPRARLLRRLLSQPRRLIATIFIGNEFVNIGASALMASVTDRYLSGQGLVVVTIVSTSVSVLLILIFGEIIPKNLAAKISERWAIRATRPIQWLAVGMAPLRWTIERIADTVVALVGRGTERPRPAVGEDEFRTMVDVVHEGGDIDEEEYQLIQNVFEFGDRRVLDVMTPAPKVFALSADLDLSEVIDRVRENTFSRVPVYTDNLDQVIGLLYAKDLIALAHRLEQSPRRLQDLLHPPFFVPKTTMCERLFHEFRRRRTHLALVVDEYARLVGLVTMEDLLEEMFGEITDEKELAASEPSPQATP